MPRRLDHPVPIGPFLDWYEKRLIYHEQIILREARLSGASGIVKPWQEATTKVLIELGWQNDADNRRLNRWKDSQVGDLIAIENALEHAGAALADVYPEHAPVLLWRHCPTCEQDVSTDRELLCPLCERRTVSSYTCPSCGGRKSGPAALCVACVERDARGHQVTDDPTATSICPGCGCPKTKYALQCWFCYVINGGHTGRRHRKNPANLRRIPMPVVEEAYRLYNTGLSVRAVARVIFDQTTCANAHACANSLFDLFRSRGWPLRDRSQATAQSNVERAWRAQCAHVFPRGSKKGQRCPKRSIGDDGFCWHHRPENIAAGVARLRATEDRAAEKLEI